MNTTTETIDPTLISLDLATTGNILEQLLDGQRAAVEAVGQAREELEAAVTAAAGRLLQGSGRLVLVGAGASGRLAVQDGAEMWPTFGWPAERLVLGIAGGEGALLHSVEGVEDDVTDAQQRVEHTQPGAHDVVVAVAASGRSAWTCEWLKLAREGGALTIGMANNAGSPLLDAADCPIYLPTGAEVLAGSTRMAAGTAQKIALNLFSTTLMIRLNRTYGNLMVDMAAVNAKLDGRRLRLLQGVLPDIDDAAARRALGEADGWVKLAVMVASGLTADQGREQLQQHQGNLRSALAAL